MHILGASVKGARRFFLRWLTAAYPGRVDPSPGVDNPRVLGLNTPAGLGTR
jgi:hypothetical protein